jgi:hypothetical protein
MGAKGNQFWKARSTHGRKPIFASADELFDAACEYFQWVDDNPLQKSIVYQGEVSTNPEPLMRAMTIEGLCIFLDIGRRTFGDYEERDDYSLVTEAIKNIIRTQKLEGASAGLLNASIIARDLGLKDNADVTSGGKPIQNTWTVMPVTTEKDG